MNNLFRHSYLHLYRLATIEGELLASAALNRIRGQDPETVCAVTALAGFRFAGWHYDSRADLSPVCQATAASIHNLALQSNSAGWQWALETERARRSESPMS
ncbi:TPA: hypothetical protein QCD44_003240 [Enterobacter hormaechei]|nr:hypothetical protein [Enterobacter hormaechei]HBM2531208.1 hypothetical protein [Enterobacter hormaechei]HBM2647487.1 hypothetical protein [Enterobacter hormaechei]HDR1965822.1 hypothetical protein [Enterobacter hormaechei]HDR1970107.1 hypothetical protein [Enterobacter hormaechei]